MTVSSCTLLACTEKTVLLEVVLLGILSCPGLV